MRLIDADELIIMQLHDENDKPVGPRFVPAEFIEEATTIEAEPKHGKWIWRGGNLYECSECEAIVVAQDYIPIELHLFCRGCGAKMDGGENG